MLQVSCIITKFREPFFYLRGGFLNTNKMTSKFDNLARLLMEENRGKTRKVDYDELAEYIKEFPEDTYKDIADAFGVSMGTVNNIARELKVGRGIGGNTLSPQARAARAAQLNALKGDEKMPRRLAKDTQEKQILDYWMANHDDMTLSELARWVKQQFNVVADKRTMVDMLRRAAAKQVPPVQLPPPDYGKGRRLKKQRDNQKKEHSKNPNYTGDVKPHYFKDTEPGIVPSEPKHGGPAKPPRSPGE